jgi:type VI protein secretion system component VasA
VLDSVLAGFAGINAFSRTTLRLSGEKAPWQRWPARSGTRRLL